MEQVYKTTGVKPPLLLNRPDFPEELLYVWKWHCDIGNATPLSNLELKSWSDLMQVNLQVWEVEVLRSLDRIYWRVMND